MMVIVFSLVCVLFVCGACIYKLTDDLLRPPRPTLERDLNGRALVTEEGRPALLGVVLDEDDAAPGAAGAGPAGARIAGTYLETARKAGLATGDLIVAAGGEPIASASDLRRILGGRHRGDTLALSVRRAGGDERVDVTLSALPLSPAELGLDYSDVAFEGGGGLTARGWFVPARGEAVGSVVVMHGNASNRRAGLSLLGPLHEAGFGVLLFDFTGRGDSDGDICTYGWREREDARQAARLASSLAPGRPVALVGRSLGASVALLAAADPRGARIDAVVADSPFASFGELLSLQRAAMHLPAWPTEWLYYALIRRRAGFDPRAIDVAREAPAVRVPVLLLHGSNDTLVPPEQSERIAGALGGAHERVILDGVGHNGERSTETIERIVSFLSEHLRARAPAAPSALLPTVVHGGNS